MQRRIYRLRAGDIKRLIVSKEPIEAPNSNEVLVEVKSIGLNFADVFAILGLYSATPAGEFIPGLEYSGLILEVGSEISHLKPGDRIMGVTRFGAYASFLNISADYVTKIPDGWSYEEGAAYLVQVLTAYYGMVRLGNLSAGQVVLIHSAAGGVGLWANRIAKSFGAFTIGTVGDRSKLELLKRERFDRMIVRDKDNFHNQLQEALEGKELNLVMECIGGKIMKIGYRQLAPMGRLILYGSAHYARKSDKPFWPVLIWKYLRRPKIDPQSMIRENKSVMAFNLIYLFDHVSLMRTLLDDLDKIDLGKPVIGHKFNFEELPDAIRLFQSGKTKGKVVINVL